MGKIHINTMVFATFQKTRKVPRARPRGGKGGPGPPLGFRAAPGGDLGPKNKCSGAPGPPQEGPRRPKRFCGRRFRRFGPPQTPPRTPQDPPGPPQKALVFVGFWPQETPQDPLWGPPGTPPGAPKDPQGPPGDPQGPPQAPPRTPGDPHGPSKDLQNRHSQRLFRTQQPTTWGLQHSTC